MKRVQPLKRASVVDEQLRTLIKEIRREQATLKCTVLHEIREGFRSLRLEMRDHGRPALPVELCAKLYAAIYQIVGAVPFTATRLLEELTEATVDADRLREALASVLSKDNMTPNKVTRFLKWDTLEVAGPWRRYVHPQKSCDGQRFRVCRYDEK